MIFFLAAAVCGLATFTFTLQSVRAWGLKEIAPRVRVGLIGWRMLDLVLTLSTFTLILAGRFEASMLYLIASLVYSFVILPRVLSQTVADAMKEEAAAAKVEAEGQP